MTARPAPFGPLAALATAAGLAVALAGVTALGAKGDSPGPSSPPAVVAGAPQTSAEGDLLVRCGRGLPFAPDEVRRGGVRLTDEERREVTAALDRVRTEARIDAPDALVKAGADDLSWVVTAREGTTTEVLLWAPGVPTDDLDRAEPVTLEGSDGGLRATSWGGTCQPEPVPSPGRGWVQVNLDGSTPGPDDITISVLLMERDCTGARDPGPHLEEPYVVETDETVTIWWATRLPESATCPSNPTVERTITLERPLGERRLLDGSRYPGLPLEPLMPAPIPLPADPT